MANWSTQTAIRECQIASNGELTVVERLANLLETGQFADVTITVGEGNDIATFKAHKLLLATASPSLNSLVSSNMKNGPEEGATIRVTDVDPDAFQHLLKYIYTDDLKIDNAGESITLLKLGKKWELQNLVEKTINFVESFLDDYEPISEERKNELCDLLTIAEELDLDLQKKCWEVLLKNVNDVVPCQGFLNMSRDMVRRLLKHPDFQFKNQLMLFEAIRDWGMNQVLQQNLNVNSLKSIIGEFLNFINFKGVTDSEFLDTIIPSDCLGKAELISFFMTRGLAIPRDLSYNNNNIQNSNMPYETTGRFQKGYKLPNQEVYQEHELRFRVDKKLRLLGVGFGFLFSNTDMGITVHCQGPWEVRQWQDIIQTYCRVSYEKMKTADVRLMFSEPVIIEPNHSYKVLVRVGRMSTGTSDVELWGGTEGTSRVKIKDAEMHFLKAAVHPSKPVEESDHENKPGMITELFYEMEDEKGNFIKKPTLPSQEISTSKPAAPKTPLTPNSPPVPSAFSPYKQQRIQNPPSFSQPISQPKKKKPVGSSTSPKIYTTAAKPREEISSPGIETVVDSVAPPESQIGSTSASNYSFRRNVPSARIEVEPPSSPTQTTPTQKKSHVEEASSYYLATRPSHIRGSETLPSYMRNRMSPAERKPSWMIPSRSKITSSIHSFKPIQPANDRDISYSSRDSRRPSIQASLFDNTSLSKSHYNYGVSNIKSKYESGAKRDARTAYEPSSQYSSRYSKPSSAPSRYTTSSQSYKPESRTYTPESSAYTPETRTYTPESRTYKPESRYTAPGSGSHLGKSSGSDASDNLSVSRYASGYRGREGTTSPSRFGRSSPSLYRQTASSRNTGKDTGLNRSTGDSTPLGTSRYGTTSTASSLGTSSRYGSGTSSNALGSSSRYGSAASSNLSTSSTGTPTSRYGTSSLSSTSTPTSRYGTSSISSTGTPTGRYGITSLSSTSTSSSLSPRYGTSTSSTGTSRYGSQSSSTPSYLSSSRFRATSPIGNKYSSGNRFGSSLYKR